MSKLLPQEEKLAPINGEEKARTLSEAGFLALQDDRFAVSFG